MKDGLAQVGLWACPWGTGLFMLTEVGRSAHSLRVTPFPRQGILDCTGMDNVN